MEVKLLHSLNLYNAMSITPIKPKEKPKHKLYFYFLQGNPSQYMQLPL